MQILRLATCVLFGVLSLSGCSRHGSDPGSMTRAQQAWADDLIAHFIPAPQNRLPSDASSPKQVIAFLEAKHPDLRFMDYYPYKGFLILPLRFVGEGERRPELDFANVVLVNVRSRQYQLVLLAKS